MLSFAVLRLILLIFFWQVMLYKNDLFGMASFVDWPAPKKYLNIQKNQLEIMNFRQIDRSPSTFVLVFETGDELAEGLSMFAEEQDLSAASFKAVGALSSVRLGWFSWESKRYEPSVTLDEQVELLSLIGDVALKDDRPVVHAHVVIGKKDGTAHGGHLLEAYVRPTCEVVLTESPAHLNKIIDRESGLALIRP